MQPITLGQISDHLSASGLPNTLEGDPDLAIQAVNTLEDAQPGELSFLANPKYAERLSTTRASALLLDRRVALPKGPSAIRSADPYAGLCMAVVKVHGYRQHPAWGGLDRADIADTAKIGPNANIAAGVTVCHHARIGKNVTLYPGVFVGQGCRVGDDVTLYPNVVVYDRCVLGDRVAIHACTVIGEDGLGYAPVGGKWTKIPQVGRVVVEDDVEIGANCSIDRATLGQTVIGNGTKFSNQVAIGHGTKVGPDCMVVAQVGVAGSTTLGRHVTLAGQAGIVGHAHIGDDATVGAKAGVRGDVEAGTTVLGTPAVPIADARRQMLMVQRLPEMRRQIKELQAQVRALCDRIERDDP
ncbi:MAG: UDP-3-O-(3-hydroxymyristoyl)glucosamine N-acyltransferase [Phycisphaerae bacterium]